MTYADQAATTMDSGFVARVTACASQEAQTFVNDARPEFHELASAIIHSSGAARPLVDLVAGKPGINVESGDPDILAAVQAVWPVYGATLLEEEVTP